MGVPPREVRLLIGAFHGAPFAIRQVLVSQIGVVSAILSRVPSVVVAAGVVVVSPVVIVLLVVRVVFSRGHYWRDHCDAQKEPS